MSIVSLTCRCRPVKKQAAPVVDETAREEAYERAPRAFVDEPLVRARCSAHLPVAKLQLFQGAKPFEQVEALPRKNAAGEWVFEPVQATAAAAAVARPSKKARLLSAAAPPAGPDASAAGASVALRARADAALKELKEEELTLEEKRSRIAAASAALLEAPDRNVNELKARVTRAFSRYDAEPLSPGPPAAGRRRKPVCCSPRLPVSHARVQGLSPWVPHSPADRERDGHGRLKGCPGPA